MQRTTKSFTIAFYNTENLFDTENDPLTNDDDFLPTSAKRWTEKRYKRKAYKIGSALAQIGIDEFNKNPPTIVGLAEIENKTVLRDLLASNALKQYNYDFVHYDSMDERGIDVALIYLKDEFELVSSEYFPVIIEDENKVRDFTRDVLLVSGKIYGEEIHIIVNHWPSRREGQELSEYKRQKAAEVNVYIIEKLRLMHTDPKIIVMGDFNNNPDNESVRYLEAEAGLFNVMKTVWSFDKGSLSHQLKWIFFDQILISINLLSPSTPGLRFDKSDVFNEKFLTQYEGKFKGQPYRTYVGKKYKGGFSDHFPVYIQLIDNPNPPKGA